VIADNCALLADAAFSGRLGPPSLPVVAIGTYAFAWQIYGDFSGYSDSPPEARKCSDSISW